MTSPRSQFWDDLVDDLRDPELLRAYVVESVRIETIDRLINSLDEARQADDLTKAELARSISETPSVVRRLLSSPGQRNPTIGTLAEVAAALGMRITLEPLPSEEHATVTTALRTGTTDDPEKLARSILDKRKLHLHANGSGTDVSEKITGRLGLSRVVHGMTFEVDDLVRVV
jgi:transcriptional regulator with XRE-family HTH domain